MCDVAAGTCTAIPERAALLCEPCVSDRQCPVGQLCVTTRFMGEDAGRFCLRPREATGVGAPGGSCITIAPYIGGFDAAGTADPATVRMCGLATTTCPALADFRMTPCDAPGEDTADRCGIVGLDDGYCAELPGSPGTNVCTTPCGSSSDCNPGFACLSGTPEVCSLST